MMHLFCKLQYVVQRKFGCCTSFPSNYLLKYDVEYTRDIAVISQSMHVSAELWIGRTRQCSGRAAT